MLSQTFGPHSIFTVIRMGILVILRTQQISTKYECLVKLKIVLLLQTHLRYTASFYIQLFLNVSCVYAPYSSPNRVLSALAATDLKFKTNRTTKLHNNIFGTFSYSWILLVLKLFIWLIMTVTFKCLGTHAHPQYVIYHIVQ